MWTVVTALVLPRLVVIGVATVGLAFVWRFLPCGLVTKRLAFTSTALVAATGAAFGEVAASFRLFVADVRVERLVVNHFNGLTEQTLDIAQKGGFTL